VLAAIAFRPAGSGLMYWRKLCAGRTEITGSYLLPNTYLFNTKCIDTSVLIYSSKMLVVIH
jgi:hypothetical protein